MMVISNNSQVNGKKIAHLIILIVISILSLRQITNTSLGYPDADRILMDGVFILDFLHDFPITHIYDYTINYYGQYPALSIGYRPPFFPFIEALFNGVFGINMWSSRLALLSFYMVGITAWFNLICRIYNWQTAFASTILLITTPFIAKWGWYTMAGLPVLSMVILTGYLFYRYTETDQAKYLYQTAIMFSLACWTKQTAIFMLLWFLIYALFQGKLFAYFKRKEWWISVFIMLVMLIPLAIITLWLGKQNITQSVGQIENYRHFSRLSWSNLTYHFNTLYRYHLTTPIFILSIAGLITSILKKDKKTLYPLCLMIGTYLFCTYLVGKNERYPIFWIPAFCFYAVLPLYHLKNKLIVYKLMIFVLLVVTTFQVKKIYYNTPNYATGYDEAAQYVLNNQYVPTVFFDGYNNGYFTYFMRALDSEKSTYVLRADKLLSSSSISSQHWLEVHVHSNEEIKKILDDYGVDLIVVESRDQSKIKIHQQFRQYLKNGPFTLLKTIPVNSNRLPLKRQQLLIYRYLDRPIATKGYITLRLPVVGQTIKVPVKNRHQTEQ